MRNQLIFVVLSLFLQGYFCDAAVAQESMPQFNAEALRKAAETRWFGYKTGNLIELENLVKWFNLTTPPMRVGVPVFVGISSKIVVKALNENGFNVATQWGTVLATLSVDEKKTPFL